VIDHLQVIVLICFIKLRWWYFHLCPWYMKFSMEGTEFHFQNMRTNTIHSQLILKFHEDSFWYKKQDNDIRGEV